MTTPTSLDLFHSRPADPLARSVKAFDPAAPVRAFVAEHQEALWQAARLLGGYERARLVTKLAEALASEPTLSRLTRQRLRALRDLLTLEHVGDPERPEMGCFAVIDPTDPVVAEICLLADGLTDAIAAWARAERRAARLAPRVAGPAAASTGGLPSPERQAAL